MNAAPRIELLHLAAFRIEPQGPFSLEEAALSGFQRHDEVFDGTMRLAFCVEGYAGQAAVAVTQDASGTVTGTITGSRGGADPAAVAAQVARVLSLDHDARSFVALGGADPVLASLLAAVPGLRPPLFSSPYEAAFSAVLSAHTLNVRLIIPTYHASPSPPISIASWSVGAQNIPVNAANWLFTAPTGFPRATASR